MTGPGQDFRLDTGIAGKAATDIGNVCDEIIGYATQMNNASDPVVSTGKGAMFNVVRTRHADLNARLNGLVVRLRDVKETAQRGTNELSYSDAAGAAEAARAAEPGSSSGSVGGVQINV